MEIPIDSLEAETLWRVVEEFVTREGTDYGAHDTALMQKVEQVIRQLKKGEAFLLFDPESESCHIVSRSQYQRLQKEKKASDEIPRPSPSNV